ncbi:hypothetical protein A2774_04100 [Candidatus Roizmanbacteria bacterium RIFCSPHIGHO2_01_FULL_39_12c]|uniref:Glycosyltransferase 2-like domain-containing protein n=1 Tax=Candidatus Roizmanbacteria bacterium RIFCSPHIGHO2_01_FULL_39_12c TaxID=1802031 RepID=A0A1F7GEQ4_9BACT|nr:MAG: hypothetical protein A2774_04100 [Candidatus Roizmanbacteria bacterium RIFCSPHIGHO2_01_FULL_39_12c]OGK48078.1 MAG: hypothetical protein A2963_03915 [Candidatus Roizmanbacteria bacterium RIFCSPLOWO2_01_FULL_40_13]
MKSKRNFINNNSAIGAMTKRKIELSLLMITKNSDELLAKSLRSVEGMVDEIVIVDNYSTDRTGEIAGKYGAKIYPRRSENLGGQKAYGLHKVKGDWVLNLDADEIVSYKLKRDIISLFRGRPTLKSHTYQGRVKGMTGYYIPFQNHFLGRTLNYGGENYKMLRLFKKDAVKIDPVLLHERFELKRGSAGRLGGKIYHYSYRSLRQMFGKFTDYAIREFKQKSRKGEKGGLKKILLYPPHMFLARFVKDKGYRDGLIRIPLDIGFAYMEYLTYFLLTFYEPKKLKIKN